MVRRRFPPDVLELRPITLRDACRFIAQHHRHNKPPRGWRFGVALYGDGVLVGVATAGRPVARELNDGLTLEINRTCTDGTRNANSMLYGACWRAAKALGYRKCVTYTQATENGASLRAVGWVCAEVLKPRGNWAESTGDDHRRARRDPFGIGWVERQRWEISC